MFLCGCVFLNVLLHVRRGSCACVKLLGVQARFETDTYTIIIICNGFVTEAVGAMGFQKVNKLFTGKRESFQRGIGELSGRGTSSSTVPESERVCWNSAIKASSLKGT